MVITQSRKDLEEEKMSMSTTSEPYLLPVIDNLCLNDEEGKK